MRSKRMLMGAALIGCVAATMIPGAYAQEANTTDQFNARASGQQPSTAGQPRPSMRQGQGAGMNAQKQGAGMNAQGQAADMNARSNTPTSNRASASGQVERRGFANEGRLNASTRERRGYAEARRMRGERGTYARISEERYGRGLRGERGLYARAGVEGGYRGSRSVYRDRAVGVGTGVAATDYGNSTRRLYAYAPMYAASYTVGPTYSYSAYGPSYAAAGVGPYHMPGWNVAYGGPYYDYTPGLSFGIGLGPVGIGVGPAWAW